MNQANKPLFDDEIWDIAKANTARQYAETALEAEREKVRKLKELLEYAIGQLEHAGYTKNAVPRLQRGLKEIEEA